MLEPIRRTTVSDTIINRFKRLVASGELKPGARLPGEMILAKSLGVSRGSVREALKGLAALGLISRSIEGTFVTRDLSQQAIDSSILEAITRGLDVRHIYETRRILEAEIARLASLRAEPKHLAAMRAQLATMEQAIESSSAFLRADLDFHLLVAEATQNPILTRILTTLLLWVARTIPDAAAVPEMPALALEHHRRLLEAIAAGDPQAAYRVAQQNLEEVEEKYLQHLATRPLVNVALPVAAVDVKEE